jgi:hypothetical protein
MDYEKTQKTISLQLQVYEDGGSHGAEEADRGLLDCDDM